MEKGHMPHVFPSLTMLLSPALLKIIIWDFIIVIGVFIIGRKEYLFLILVITKIYYKLL